MAKNTDALLAMIREGRPMSSVQQLRLTIALSVPAIVAQLSYIIMQYIDAAMVGSLGADASASIGLVSTTTWLFWGLCVSATTGFSVQVAHRIGAGDFYGACSLLRQAITATLAFSALLAIIGVSISERLPVWLGGTPEIHRDASLYFMIFAMFLPMLQMSFVASGMLRCSGNMHFPSLIGVVMCLLDVIFNFFLIFPSRYFNLCGISLYIPGADMGVEGAALGTVLAESVAAIVMMWYLCYRSPHLKLKGNYGSFMPTRKAIQRALHIGLPMGVEHAVICGAQIMTTVIVAPLGIFAIAANSFAVTAESLCYMPGYGIADAATTLVGQSLGAGRRDLTKRFAYITVYMGMAVMGVMGVIMYLAAPQIIGIMTPVDGIRDLGVMSLRIEAFAEPMFAAAIVGYAVFVGATDTLVPCVMNLVSIWAVRISLAALLAPSMGLKGVWIAMCLELCFRGAIFLARLWSGRWIKIGEVHNAQVDKCIDK